MQLPKPSHLQRFVASRWAIRIWFSITSLGAIGYTYAQIPSYAFFNIKTLLLIIAMTPAAAALGFMLGVFPGGIIIGALSEQRGIANGAPFKPGDKVLIITERNYGQVAEIYEMWQGNAFRVRIDDAAKEKFLDIYSSTEVIRIPEPPHTD